MTDRYMPTAMIAPHPSNNATHMCKEAAIGAEVVIGVPITSVHQRGSLSPVQRYVCLVPTTVFHLLSWDSPSHAWG